MNIVKERTRLLFSEYTPEEKRAIENKVAAMDNIFMYVDPDKDIIGVPTGMEKTAREMFPNARFIDRSNEYWDYARITPVTHDAKPRNQLQNDFIGFVLDHAKRKEKLAGILSVGTGKGIPLTAKIPAPNKNGFIRMGDLVVGDKIFGSDGKQVTVTGIYDQGEEDVYKITFNDGRYALCDENHLWNVFYYWTSKIVTVRTGDMINDYKTFYQSLYDAGKSPCKYKYRIPLLSSPIEYDFREVPVHPYVVGAFIGNGCCTEPVLKFSSGDEFVPNKIAGIMEWSVKYPKSGYTYVFHDKNGHCIKSTDVFIELPEICNRYSHEKCIPEIYMHNSLEVRMELLRGLMDTDGSIRLADGRYNVSYSSCSKKLLEQIQELIRGLGFISSIHKQDSRVEKYKFGYHSEVSIRVPNYFKQELFSHPKKYKLALDAARRGDLMQPFTHLIIKEIKKVTRAECRCITVDAPDQLYLTEDYIVTHNTFMACYSAIAVGQRTLIIAPTSGIKDQWEETLVKMFKVPADRVLNVRSPRDFFHVTADFVVISQASLQSLNKTYDLERIMKDNKFGIKVIDEVQMWFKNIINVDANSNIANNWYLTGTFGRSGEDENRIYQEMFGDLAIFREEQKKATVWNPKPGNVYGMKPYIHTKMIWTHAGLSEKDIKEVTNSMRYSEREGKWVRYGISMPAYTNKIIPPDGRMTKYIQILLDVVKQANKEVKYGRMLILVGTIAATEVVAKYVSHMLPGKKVGTFHSENQKDLNDRNKKECDILISTTQSAGTGFDMKDLAKLILSANMKSWILATQCVGRLRRRPDGKDCYCWDIVDADIKQLRAWANVRAETVRKMSKTFKVVDYNINYRECFDTEDNSDILDTMITESTLSESDYVPVFAVAGSYTTNTDQRNNGENKSSREIGYANAKKFIHKLSGGDNYSHLGISFDYDLSTIYSYDSNGMQVDSINNELWNTCDSIYISAMYIHKNDVDNMKKYIDQAVINKDKSKYDYVNMFRMYFLLPKHYDYRYVCSTFVGSVLNKANPRYINRDYSRVRPEDATVLPRSYFIGCYKDNTDFNEKKDQFKDKVDQTYADHAEEIDEYNNMLPKVILQDNMQKLHTLDKLVDWIMRRK